MDADAKLRFLRRIRWFVTLNVITVVTSESLHLAGLISSSIALPISLCSLAVAFIVLIVQERRMRNDAHQDH